MTSAVLCTVDMTSWMKNAEGKESKRKKRTERKVETGNKRWEGVLIPGEDNNMEKGSPMTQMMASPVLENF